MTLVILVADGARPDTLSAAIDAGELPALAALRREGGAHVVTSVFPSVTGPAYVPFLMGVHPGDAGLPGIRWWDRSGAAAYAHGNARSYVGWEALRQDGDLSPRYATLFERARNPLAALSPIGRGLAPHQRLGASLGWWPRYAWTHFRGDVDGWLSLEARLAARFADRVATGAHDLAFFAHPCVDKFSHQLGHHSPEVRAALRSVDAMVARLRADAARDGRPLDLIVTSDHGHSPVHSHFDLAGSVRRLGFGVMAHPFTFAGGDDVAVMVGGNAMAHLYLELGRRERPWWPALGARWGDLASALLAHESTDLLLLPHGPDACEVRRARRGRAMVRRDPAAPHARFMYETLDGDPLECAASTAGGWLDAESAYDATIGSPYPDSLVQILSLAGSARAGEIIVSASPGWDLRATWEPIPHVSTHGSLRREHLLVPLLTSFPTARPPRRTSDVYALASDALTRS